MRHYRCPDMTNEGGRRRRAHMGVLEEISHKSNGILSTSSQAQWCTSLEGWSLISLGSYVS